MSWLQLTGKPTQYIGPVGSGASGTITLGAGEILLQVVVHASAGAATLSIFGGPAIVVVNGANPTIYQFFHTLFTQNASTISGWGTIVGVNTDQLYVQAYRPGNV